MHYPIPIRKNAIHLYDPQEEGLGTYDVHYINAYKKILNYNTNKRKGNKTKRRKVA